MPRLQSAARRPVTSCPWVQRVQMQLRRDRGLAALPSPTAVQLLPQCRRQLRRWDAAEAA